MSNKIRASTSASPWLSASLVSICTNLMLAAVKLVCGILCAAPALVSDAIHSTADLLSTVIVLVGLRMSARSPDKSHPYGHERFECLASILLSGILLATGLAIGFSAVRAICTGTYRDAAPPERVAAVVACFSIAVKLALSGYMRGVAKRTRSTALRAESLHQISDAFASLGTLLGIVMALLGFVIFERLASVLIACFLLHAAVSIFRESAVRLVDHSAGDETEARLRAAVLGIDGVVAVERLYTRLFGSRIYVEAELTLDASLTLSDCTLIVTTAKERLLCALPEIKGCTVTVVPQDARCASGLREDP